MVFSLTTLTVVLFFLLVGEVVLFVLTWKQRQFMRCMFGAAEAREILNLLNENRQKGEELHKNLRALLRGLQETSDIANKSMHKIGVVRFNPFQSLGGEQSFCLALLDGDDSGVVISSLQGKDMTHIYAKPIVAGASQYPLSREEKDAIERATRPTAQTNG